MKNTKVSLVPLTADDREQFILDNQWAFKYGAMMEFGERDGHTVIAFSLTTAMQILRFDRESGEHFCPPL